MREKYLALCIFIWSVFMMFNDLKLLSDSSAINLFSSLIIAFHFLICWIAYQMRRGKRWSLLCLTLYFSLLVINFFRLLFILPTLKLNMLNIGMQIVSFLFLFFLTEKIISNRIKSTEAWEN